MTAEKSTFSRRFCVAPMMKRTDVYFRHLLRMLSRRAMLYTEMIPSRAVLFGGRAQQNFEVFQVPLALQLGGSEPGEMAACARIAEDAGYDEVNINVGCPSQRVERGAFGVCLMRTPQVVGECIASMSARTGIPLSVKCRIGIGADDEQDESDNSRTFIQLCQFIEIVSSAGCQTFIVHARKAVIGGLTPEQNHRIPRLRYALVKRLKREFPQLEIILNGGLESLDQAKSRLDELGVDGVMLGRAVYRQPWLLAGVDAALFGEPPLQIAAEEVIARYVEYLLENIQRGAPASLAMRHLVTWFRGQDGARCWRRYLSEDLPRRGWEVDSLELMLKISAFDPAFTSP